MIRKIPGAILILCGLLSLAAVAFSQPAGHEKPIYEKWEKGAVERWHRPEIKGKRSWFQALIEEVTNAVWPSEKPPFGRSVALLTGVSDYEHISPDLPSVEKDLKDMREFLLGDGGFDEVFVIKNEKLDRDIIERYVKSKLPNRVGKNGRLLFYFSGHGGSDINSSTGYMQFRQAKAGRFHGRNVLAINNVQDWSKEAKVKHLLVMLDCCASGLAFDSKGTQGCATGILNTLSGQGSRIVITAGTGKEDTYAAALDVRGKTGNGVFTRAFLDAFKDKKGKNGDCALFIMDDIIASIKYDVASFSMASGREVNPRKWDLGDKRLKGNFVFIKPGGRFTDEQIETGRLTRKSGAAPVVAIIPGEKYGTIEVLSLYDGRVYVDGVDLGRVSADVAGKIHFCKVGPHSVKVEGENENQTQKTTVSYNSTVRVTFMKKNGVESVAPPMAITRPETSTHNSTTASQTAPASPITNSIGMKFVYIEPGSFDMGSPSDEPERYDNETQHKVTLTQGYYMQTTEVTQKQWRSVMGDNNNPSKFKECGDKCPVEKVSWNDVQKFIKKLNKKEGVSTYRLPTEAEWEYAARAGTTTPFSLGDGKCLSTDQANYRGTHPMPGCPKGEYREETVPVASFQPNGWGLYDMHGNVYEWCQDWYGDYPNGSVTNPVGPRVGEDRVMRGGGWNDLGRFVRSADRYWDVPGDRWHNIGFRLARGH